MDGCSRANSTSIASNVGQWPPARPATRGVVAWRWRPGGSVAAAAVRWPRRGLGQLLGLGRAAVPQRGGCGFCTSGRATGVTGARRAGSSRALTAADLRGEGDRARPRLQAADRAQARPEPSLARLSGVAPDRGWRWDAVVLLGRAHLPLAEHVDHRRLLRRACRRSAHLDGAWDAAVLLDGEPAHALAAPPTGVRIGVRQSLRHSCGEAPTVTPNAVKLLRNRVGITQD